MATKAKETHEKKLLKSSTSVPSSPDRVPNYLRQTVSSAKDISSKSGPTIISSVKDVASSKPTGKKPVADDASPRSTMNRRKSLDKPASQSQPQRTSSSNSREKTPKTSSPSPKLTSSSKPGTPFHKTTSSSPKRVISSSPKPIVTTSKSVNSSKPIVEKTSKITPRVVKTGTHHPVIAKTKTFKRTTSNVSCNSSKQHDDKGDDTSPTITTTTTTTTTTDVLEISGAEEGNDILEQEVVDGENVLKVEEDEEIPTEIPQEDDLVEIVQNINNIEPEHLKEDDVPPVEIIEARMEVEEEEEEVIVRISSPPAEEAQEETIDQIQIEEHHCEDKDEEQEEEKDKKDIEDEPLEIVEVEEKTEMEPEDNVEETNEGEGEEEGIGEKPVVIVKGEVKSPGSDNEETKAYKMKFRQGKELEVEGEDGGNQQRINFKEAERLEEEEEEMRDEAGNLMLKKQEVNKGKKESQAYNDVIEETASKLVGKRKSKVRALVGAFETVISLEGTEGQ